VSLTLPAAAESVRCTVFAAENRIDPGGTGLAPDVIVLVEVAEPWPKPAGKHPDLVDFVSAAALNPAQIRLLAAEPHDPTARRILTFRPADGGMLRTELPLGDDAVSTLQAALDAEPTLVLSGPGAPRSLLVCTQGSHDICCGDQGVEFADAAEASRPDVELFRVSHTGGHRFAPTAMTLPDGRMWAWLNPASLDGLLDRTMTPAEAAASCRGWWGTPTGPRQVAERAVFAERGFELDDVGRTVETEEIDGGHMVTVTVSGETPQRFLVRPGREVVTIACDAPGGQPTKPGREWTVEPA
jgi:hypothetical protein